MTEKEFIQSYIKKINDAINEFGASECNENIIFDCIQEIRGVFCRDIPEIDEAIWMRTGTAERDANIVLGLLNKQLIDKSSVSNDSEAKSDQFLRDYKDLELEFEGIRKNIDKYTSEANVINYLSQLDKAIKANDLYVIKYCLKGIQEWYKANIGAIHQNEFCINPESHDENQGKIDRFVEIFSSYSENDACLNEMGAAWLAQSDYTNVYVPNFSFGNPKYHECAVDTRKMGAVLNGDKNCKASMLELKEKIQHLFQLIDDPRNAQYLIDNFIEEIAEEK